MPQLLLMVGGQVAVRTTKAAWVLDPTMGEAYQEHVFGFQAQEKWQHSAQWLGKSSFVPSKWTEEEFSSLLDSGRIIWRPVPGTPNVWEYQDTQEFTYNNTVKHIKKNEGSRRLSCSQRATTTLHS